MSEIIKDEELSVEDTIISEYEERKSAYTTIRNIVKNEGYGYFKITLEQEDRLQHWIKNRLTHNKKLHSVKAVESAILWGITFLILGFMGVSAMLSHWIGLAFFMVCLVSTLAINFHSRSKLLTKEITLDITTRFIMEEIYKL